MKPPARRRLFIAPCALLVSIMLCAAAPPTRAGALDYSPWPNPGEWPMFGQNWANTATGRTLSIGPANVPQLKPKWIFTTQGDVSARAAVTGGGVYFPDWGGYLHKLDAKTGTALWSRNLVTDYGLIPAAGSTKVVSRTTPAIYGDTL